MSRLVDAIEKSLSGVSGIGSIGAREVEKADPALRMSDYPVTRPPGEDRSTVIGTYDEGRLVAAADQEAHEASWADAPAWLLKGGWYGRRPS
jgi:hypothetical protein